MKVEIYSDVACPWCYIGKKRFEKALAAFPQRDAVEITYRAFQLNPDLSADPSEARPQADYLRDRFGPGYKAMLDRVVEVAAGEGIAFNADAALVASTFAAHRLVWFAEQEGGSSLKARMVDALFKAQFTDGGNVADPAALLALATGVGLDAERTRAFLASDAGASEVREELEEGHALGITGVPTFVFEGKWGVSGAQEAETFLRILEQVEGEMGATVPETAAPACEDDACAL
ncbi:DsbA family oxidoreductase [bacterium]|nr:DsbA family oxidoreductase [bacterium]